MTQTVLLADIQELQQILRAEDFAKPEACPELRWIVGELVRMEEATLLIHWRWLHAYATVVRCTRRLPGWPRLRKQLVSHRGFELQLKATFYLQNNTRVRAIEWGSPKENADVVIEVNGEELWVEIKTIDQLSKRNRVEQAYGIISVILHDECPRCGDGRSLFVAKFEGIVPEGLGTDEWRSLLTPLPTGPETRNILFPNGDRVCLRVDYVERGEVLGLNLFRNLPFHLDEVELKKPAGAGRGVLFLGVVPAPATNLFTGDFRKAIELFVSKRKVLGVLFLEQSPSGLCTYYKRSPIFRTAYSNMLVDALEAQLPLKWQFAYDRDEIAGGAS